MNNDNYNFLTFDLETKGLGGPLVIGGLYDGDRYWEFTTIEGLFKTLANNFYNDRVTTIYSHNGGKYDNRYILEYALNNGFKVTKLMPIHNGLVFNVHIAGQIYSFKDSFHLLPRNLKDLTESFECTHVKQDFDIKQWIDDKCPVTEELKYYLKMDCMSLHEVLRLFMGSVDSCKTTIASTSFKALITEKYLSRELSELCKNYLTKSQEQDIRQAYKGGRVEVFIRKGYNLNKYDVNSLYPAVMHDYDYPLGKVKYYKDIDKLEGSLKLHRLGVVKARIKAPEGMNYPYLAFHYDNKLMFPLGSWVDWITTFEVQEARKRGYKIEMIEGYIYNQRGQIFKEFVRKHYKTKAGATGARKEIAKLFLNSSYGKWGQKREMKVLKTLNEILESGDNLKDYEYVSYELGLMQKKEESYRNRMINPVYAVFVTAYARHNLYLGIEEIQRQGGNVYYVDTDCIVSDIELPSKWVDSKKLGAWKAEHPEGGYKEAVFIAPKLYAMYSDSDIVMKLKGIPKDSIETLTYDDMSRLLDSDKLIFEVQRLSGVFEHFKRKETDKSKFLSTISNTKQVTNEYDKRVLAKDNIHTSPIVLDIP